ncbi:MAG: ABC transporter permease [Methylovulum sp.]|jgi:putative ABC transport system permease protein|nr:ABC transporter permease [Methylovulum sp.]MCF7999499.1 ABC transporter permease [Methylovulum sp.]
MMLWQKIRADFGYHKARTALAILSIAVGVFCVGTLFGMIDLQLTKMDASHRQSQPSHINLLLRQDTDLALLDMIRSMTNVTGVDTLSPLTVRFKLANESEWRIGTLIFRAPPEAQRFDKTTVLSGHWPSGSAVAIERLSAKMTGLKSGDSVEFATLTGTQVLPISGVVRHPFVKPPKFGGQVHFFADVVLAQSFGVSPHSFRQLLVQTPLPYQADTARKLARELGAFLATQQRSVNATLLQDPEQHWGRPFLAGVNGVLQMMAIMSLVLASVLILNTVSAHIAQQTDQIGIMKALGARRLTLIRFYLLETSIMAITAIILALPLALIAAYFSSCQLLALFNIDCGGFVYSQRAVGIMVLGGLFAPLLASLAPILRGASMTAREAMASYGLGADFGHTRFDRWIERIGTWLLPSFYALALGNLFRRKARLVLTQSVLICAGVMFLVLMSLVASVNLTLDNELARSQYAVRLGFSPDQPEAAVVRAAISVRSTIRVELWQRLAMDMSQHGEALRQKGSLGTQLLALPPDTVLYQPLIEAGRWLNVGDNGKHVLVLSADTAALNGIQVGDNVDLRLGTQNQVWQVIGLYRWLAGSHFAVEPVYAPLETVQNISQQREMASFALLSAYITTLDEEADYLHQLKKAFQDQQIALDVYSTLAKLEQRQFTRNQFTPVLTTLLGLAAMIAGVGGIGLSGTLAISVLQRTREIGVLRAIGAPATAIFRLFLMEGVLHAGVSWLVSVPLAYLAAEPLAKQLGKTMLGIQLDFVFNGDAVGYWLVMVLVIAALASYWPARKAAHLTVRECLL